MGLSKFLEAIFDIIADSSSSISKKGFYYGKKITIIWEFVFRYERKCGVFIIIFVWSNFRFAFLFKWEEKQIRKVQLNAVNIIDSCIPCVECFISNSGIYFGGFSWFVNLVLRDFCLIRRFRMDCLFNYFNSTYNKFGNGKLGWIAYNRKNIFKRGK